MYIAVRWLVRRDLPRVLDIERAAFPHPWSEDGFLTSLRQQHCIGMVAERDELVVGYMLYEPYKTRLQVINFAVDPHFHREGIGTEMARRLMEKLSLQRRTSIDMLIRETNLPAQLFWRAMGFRCESITSGMYGDTPDDAYEFVFRLPVCSHG